jgi:hypothetical protein
MVLARTAIKVFSWGGDMIRAVVALLLCLLLAMCLGGAAGAQLRDPRDPGLDEMKYRAIYGRPPPPPEEQEKDKAQEPGEEPEEEAKPQYRWGSDPLLNPGSRPSVPPPAPLAAPSPSPAAPGSPAPLAGEAPPQEAGDGPPLPPGANAPGPRRLIEVQVSDDLGNPIPDAQVSVTTREMIALSEGVTNGLGLYSAEVPCYQPGRPGGLTHTVRVMAQQGLESRLVFSNRNNCDQPAEVSFVLVDESQQRRLEQEYRRRQFLYEQEDEQKKKLLKQQEGK